MAKGWPFLVARGRQSGYTTRLAPDFLVESRTYGVIEDVVGAGSQVTTVDAGGHGLAVVWAEHKVTGADIGSAEAPRDEHSRPLHLLYGFVCPDAAIVQPSEVDLSWTRQAALDTYRRFLADERGFTLESSGPFELHSTVAGTAQPPVISRRMVPFAMAGLVAVAAVGIVMMTSFSGGEPTQPPCPQPTTTASTPAMPTTTPPSKVCP
jgi:hypothetical protein